MIIFPIPSMCLGRKGGVADKYVVLGSPIAAPPAILQYLNFSTDVVVRQGNPVYLKRGIATSFQPFTKFLDSEIANFYRSNNFLSSGMSVWHPAPNVIN
jgi:hypothetical protein